MAAAAAKSVNACMGHDAARCPFFTSSYRRAYGDDLPILPIGVTNERCYRGALPALLLGSHANPPEDLLAARTIWLIAVCSPAHIQEVRSMVKSV